MLCARATAIAKAPLARWPPLKLTARPATRPTRESTPKAIIPPRPTFEALVTRPLTRESTLAPESAPACATASFAASARLRTHVLSRLVVLFPTGAFFPNAGQFTFTHSRIPRPLPRVSLILLPAARPPTPLTTAPGLPVGVGDLQLLSQHHHLLQAAENLLGHPLRQIHKAVVVMDINLPDVPALQARLVGNGAHDIPRLHAMDMSHFDPESLEGNVVRPALLTRRLALLPLTPGRTLKVTALAAT
jgi:hypothetical protein